jgi:hypothetical protein
MAGGKLEKAILGSGSGCANIGSLAHGSRTSQFLAMDDDGGSSQTPPRSSREEGLGREERPLGKGAAGGPPHLPSSEFWRRP